MMRQLASFLKVPMYQVGWNGVALEDIAKSIRVSITELAGRNFYAEFYRTLAAGGYKVGTDWLDEKARASRRVRAVLDAADPLWRDHGRVALAVGAGLGVIEIPLIAESYRIHLHEVQNESLRYFETHSTAPAEKIYIAPSLAEIPTDTYDAIYLSQIVYAFDDSLYQSVLAHAFRILRHGGTLPIWDPECRLIELRLFYERFRPAHRTRGVFWGWARSRWLHAAMARKAGFKLSRHIGLSSAYDPVGDEGSVFGCMLPGSKAITQELVLTKPALAG